MGASKNASPPGQQPLDRGSSASSSSGGTPKKANELNLAYQAEGLPVTVAAGIDVKKGLWDDFKKKPEEGALHYTRRLCSEGQSVPDAFLTCAASQIGQVMLTCPNALWKTGLISGGIFMSISIVISTFTMYLMNVMYVEYKRAKVAAGKWSNRTHATQYHDVLGFHAGKWVAYAAQTVVVLQLLGTGIAQVIACAGDLYAIEKGYTKRELQLIFGAILQLFALFPTFAHFRILNLFALVGTTMTAVFLLYSAHAQGYNNGAPRLWPVDVPGSLSTAPQYFFTGGAVLMGALGGHSISMEMIDVMETPGQYTTAYCGGALWTIFLVVPHSIAINLAFPNQIGDSDNVFGVIPMSKAKIASVSLMILHQFAAYAYYVTPVMYLWERFIGTHTRPWYIRLPSRLPVTLLVWFLAMAFPFYGPINSFMGSISVPFTSFALPCIVFFILYRTREKRQAAPLPPWKWLQAREWLPMFIICGASVLVFTGFGAASIFYSLKSIVDQSKYFGVFARCYQCAPNYEKLLRNPNTKV